MDGLQFENNELIYYKSGKPYHAGIIKVGDDIYYISKGGRAIKGQHIVHRSMANDIIDHGTYTFGDDYKLVPGSYIPPKQVKKKTNKKAKRLQKKNNKRKKLTKKDKQKIVCVSAACIALATLLIILAFADKHIKTPGKSTDDTSTNNTTPVEVMLPQFDEEVLLCSETAKMVYDGELAADAITYDEEPYRPFVFEYTLIGTDGELIISEYPDLREPKEFILSSKANALNVDNLKTGTVYYYKVTVGEDEYLGSFATAKSTRFINIPGVYNTRDIGGYATLDGKTVKQGYIIRGTELDGLVEPTYYLDNDYTEYIADEFGFVYDFDLRSPDIFMGRYKSRLGESVGHYFYNSPQYGAIFRVLHREILKKIFSDLANPDNYPMYLHCTYGADRTGTIIFLLQGLLNMSEEDMRTEYLRTNHWGNVKPFVDVISSGLQGYNGETLSEKVVDFLVSDIGVTEAEIASIRNILLED